MYLIAEDEEILWREAMDLLKLYQEKFGERFICFNYVDFPGTKTQRPAEMYCDILKKALRDNKPCRMVSHRYDRIDH